MGWTVIIEDEEGNAKKTMPGEFILSDEEVLSKESFRLLKYVDPYGDTTFNAFMFEDLIKDLIEMNDPAASWRGIEYKIQPTHKNTNSHPAASCEEFF